MPRRLELRRGLFALLLVTASAASAAAHEGARPHHFLMTQVEIRDSVLYIDVWLERPTELVTAEFRSMFRHDPDRAEEQDAEFDRMNFQRMIDAMTVSLGGEELALRWEPGPLVNNGQGNDRFFTWAIVATAPVPPSRTELDLRIENRLFETEHVFLSCYVQLDDDWRVAFDSARATLDASDHEVRPDRAGVSWTHDPSVRNWELRLRR
jgi:hypothetical protein